MSLITAGIDHLNLDVKNLDQSVEFYNKLFGFTVFKEQPEENSKIIGNDHVKLCLYQRDEFDHFEKNGFNHFGLHIKNFEDVMQKCTELGIEVYYGGQLDWERSSSIYIKDPNGYEIELAKVFGGGL
ncbi:MAG: VOC family protein [Ignavibacteriaceae bacterium]